VRGRNAKIIERGQHSGMKYGGPVSASRQRNADALRYHRFTLERIEPLGIRSGVAIRHGNPKGTRNCQPATENSASGIDQT
jgi:hypothetical protein